jgi:hypothetical protein
MQTHQKLVLLKDGNQHEMYYENDDIEFGVDLNEDEYKKLFENFQSNTSFSTPDKMIQDNITNGNTYPTFKTSMSFNNNDMKEIVDSFRKEMNFVIEEKNRKRKCRKKLLLQNKTRKQQKPKSIPKKSAPKKSIPKKPASKKPAPKKSKSKSKKKSDKKR